MAGLYSIPNNHHFEHRLIPKIGLGSTRTSIFNPHNLPLKPNQVTHHQVPSTAFMCDAASSVGRVMQPYHFTIMLVVVQVIIVFHVAHTSNHHLLFAFCSSTPGYSAPRKKMLQKGT
jgi:hypothetical protein